MNFPPKIQKCSQKTTKFSQEYGMTTTTKEKEIKLFDITKTRALFQGFTILK